MKVKFSVVNGQENHNFECNIEWARYEDVIQSLCDAIDLHRLRGENYLREYKERKSKEPRVTDPPKTSDLQYETRFFPHENIYEYDGAFRCMDCQSQWGALLDAPDMPPAECKLVVCPETHLGLQCQIRIGHKGSHEHKDNITGRLTCLSWPRVST